MACTGVKYLCNKQDSYVYTWEEVQSARMHCHFLFECIGSGWMFLLSLHSPLHNECESWHQCFVVSLTQVACCLPVLVFHSHLRQSKRIFTKISHMKLMDTIKFTNTFAVFPTDLHFMCRSTSPGGNIYNVNKTADGHIVNANPFPASRWCFWNCRNTAVSVVTAVHKAALRLWKLIYQA